MTTTLADIAFRLTCLGVVLSGAVLGIAAVDPRGAAWVVRSAFGRSAG